ncbi:MAG: iron chelate uptake ABC transporter family permease subunit, partial [Nocardioides sp.]
MALDLAGEERGAAATARVRALTRLDARPRMRRTKIVVGVLACLGAVVVGCLVGPAGLSVSGVLLELLDAVPGVEVDSGMSLTQQAIFWEIRLPRVVLGVLVGAMLAVAGTAYQGVFRNPLADPY